MDEQKMREIVSRLVREPYNTMQAYNRQLRRMSMPVGTTAKAGYYGVEFSWPVTCFPKGCGETLSHYESRIVGWDLEIN